jgi:large conductance mechanosensitive channel
MASWRLTPRTSGGFKEFALRGNVIDMAVGIIIGATFSTIVKSLVDDIIMPPIGVITGGVDFSSIFIPLNGDHYDSSWPQGKPVPPP